MALFSDHSTKTSIVIQNGGVTLLGGLDLSLHHYNENGSYTGTTTEGGLLCQIGCQKPLTPPGISVKVLATESVQINYPFPPWALVSP